MSEVSLELQRVRAIRMREDEGATIDEIAVALGVPRSSVGDWVRGLVPLPNLPEELETEAQAAEGERLSRLSKLCSRCGRVLPWTEFWVKAKWPDGTMRRPQSCCRDCTKARLRERRRLDPEWAREVNRRDWERIKADPEKLARRRELTRENGVVHRLRRREAA